MSEKLEPCPLCGSDDVYVDIDDPELGEYQYWHAGCCHCGISIKRGTEEGAIKKWNDLKNKKRNGAMK